MSLSGHKYVKTDSWWECERVVGEFEIIKKIKAVSRMHEFINEITDKKNFVILSRIKMKLFSIMVKSKIFYGNPLAFLVRGYYNTKVLQRFKASNFKSLKWMSAGVYIKYIYSKWKI